VNISRDWPDDTSRPIMTKVGKVGDMDEVIKRSQCSVDRFSSAGSVAS
jgi:hypothetical protein